MVMTTCTVNEINLVMRLARFFSKVSGEEVSSSRAIHLLNAQISFMSIILFGGFSLIVTALMVSWFALSVYQCSKIK